MSTITDPADTTATMTYSGLADTDTVTGQVDEHADSRGVVEAMIAVNRGDSEPVEGQMPAPLRRGEEWRRLTR